VAASEYLTESQFTDFDLEIDLETVCCGNHKKRRPNQGEKPKLLDLK
jgi:hypothetical protein